ncbi:MAG: NfeD family protein [Nannocystaceae bacterium]
MLLSFYIFWLVLGAILIGASIFFSGNDADADADVDVDAEVDVDVDVDAADVDVHTDSAGQDRDHGLDRAGGEGSLVGFAASLLSLRFWTFFATFFGATGLVLDGLDLVESSQVTAGLAVGMGVLVGQGAVAVFRAMARDEVGTAASEADYIGQTARVLMAVSDGRQGKIRIQIRGTTVDLLATTTDDLGFEEGDEALVIDMDGTRAVVSHGHTPAEPRPAAFETSPRV